MDIVIRHHKNLATLLACLATHRHLIERYSPWRLVYSAYSPCFIVGFFLKLRDSPHIAQSIPIAAPCQARSWGRHSRAKAP